MYKIYNKKQKTMKKNIILVVIVMLSINATQATPAANVNNAGIDGGAIAGIVVIITLLGMMAIPKKQNKKIINK